MTLQQLKESIKASYKRWCWKNFESPRLTAFLVYYEVNYENVLGVDYFNLHEKREIFDLP